MQVTEHQTRPLARGAARRRIACAGPGGVHGNRSRANGVCSRYSTPPFPRTAARYLILTLNYLCCGNFVFVNEFLKNYAITVLWSTTCRQVGAHNLSTQRPHKPSINIRVVNFIYVYGRLLLPARVMCVCLLLRILSRSVPLSTFSLR